MHNAWEGATVKNHGHAEQDADEETVRHPDEERREKGGHHDAEVLLVHSIRCYHLGKVYHGSYRNDDDRSQHRHWNIIKQRRQEQ